MTTTPSTPEVDLPPAGSPPPTGSPPPDISMMDTSKVSMMDISSMIMMAVNNVMDQVPDPQMDTSIVATAVALSVSSIIKSIVTSMAGFKITAPPQVKAIDLSMAIANFALLVEVFTSAITGPTTNEWWAGAEHIARALMPNAPEDELLALVGSHIPWRIMMAVRAAEQLSLTNLKEHLLEEFKEEKWMLKMAHLLQVGELCTFCETPKVARCQALHTFEKLGKMPYIGHVIVNHLQAVYSAQVHEAHLEFAEVECSSEALVHEEIEAIIKLALSAEKIQVHRMKLQAGINQAEQKQASCTKATSAKKAETKAAATTPVQVQATAPPMQATSSNPGPAPKGPTRQ
ncbi:hypothetical protein H4S07_000989 [Coemansia furcata]|uniref:Uncharacterized protein n=1 Tax=Coemansia furcata TaxID=417177 RepID=A0ACC1LPM1_9FUNG|nr:hypothetical protein H4S07_000989 [Coemansia furcata]